MLTLSITTDIFLPIIGAVAGVVDSIAGSGGIVTVPAMLAFGVPPIFALGTNKLQESVGQIAATHRFYKTGEMQFRVIAVTAFFTAIGTSIGALLVQTIHADLLKKIVPILIMLALVYSIFSGHFFSKQQKPRLRLISFALTFGIGIGFYNGFFGPGTGSLCAALFLYFLSMDMKHATMYAKPINLTCNLVALIWFVMQRHVLFTFAMLLGAGQIIGALLGAKLVLTKGSNFVRYFFISIVMLLTSVLLYKQFMLI